MEKRFSAWTALDTRTTKRGEPVKQLTAEAVGKMVLSARRLIMEIMKTKINALFKKFFAAHFPDYTWKAGTKKVTCIDDLVECIRTEKYDKLMRRICFMALNGFWEKNNKPILEIESQIMYMFRWKYINTSCFGAERKRLTNGACIKALGVKQKNTELEKIKTALRTYKLEAFFVRYMLGEESGKETESKNDGKEEAADDAAEKEDGNAKEQNASDNAKAKKNSKVCAKAQKNSKGKKEGGEYVLGDVFRVTESEWGFDGYLGLYEGHVHLKERREKKNGGLAEHPDLSLLRSGANLRAATMAPDVQSDEDLIAYVRELMKAGKVRTKTDLARVLVDETDALLGEADPLLAFLNSPLPTNEIVGRASHGLISVSQTSLSTCF